jgi:tight adherence protein C
MTPELSAALFAIAAAAAALVLIVREIHIRTLNTRVANAVLGAAGSSARSENVIGWFSSIGMRYKRFYAAEELEQLQTVLQAAGFNYRRTLPIWVGVKIVSMVLFPFLAFMAAQLSGKPPSAVLIFSLLGVVVGIMGPRLILTMMRRRFDAAVRRGTPDTIDLLVVCSEAGMGLESAIERVAGEMSQTNPAMAQVLYGLLDDLRILPNRSDAFEKLGATSDGLRRFGTVIAQSLQYGTPLGRALRAIAADLRQERLTNLEERAHKLGAKLTIPMVLFLLPAMFVTLGGSPFLHLIRAFKQF